MKTALAVNEAAHTDAPGVARSIGAVFAGFATVFVLSLVTDQLLHVLQVYPPWGSSMHEPGLNALALSYRLVYTVLGGYVTARITNRMRDVWILAFIGLALGTLGAVATIPMNLGPAWYPIALAVTAVPCTWLGGRTRAASSRYARGTSES